MPSRVFLTLGRVSCNYKQEKGNQKKGEKKQNEKNEKADMSMSYENKENQRE